MGTHTKMMNRFLLLVAVACVASFVGAVSEADSLITPAFLQNDADASFTEPVRGGFCMPKLTASLMALQYMFKGQLLVQAPLGASKKLRQGTQASTATVQKSSGQPGKMDLVLRKVKHFFTMFSNAPMVGPMIKVMKTAITTLRTMVTNLLKQIFTPLKPALTSLRATLSSLSTAERPSAQATKTVGVALSVAMTIRSLACACPALTEKVAKELEGFASSLIKKIKPAAQPFAKAVKSMKVIFQPLKEVGSNMKTMAKKMKVIDTAKKILKKLEKFVDWISKQLKKVKVPVPKDLAKPIEKWAKKQKEKKKNNKSKSKSKSKPKKKNTKKNNKKTNKKKNNKNKNKKKNKNKNKNKNKKNKNKNKKTNKSKRSLTKRG